MSTCPSQTTLALIVAVLSVATTLLTTVIPLMQSRTAQFALSVIETDEKKITVLVRNTGSGAGALRLATLAVSTPPQDDSDWTDSAIEFRTALLNFYHDAILIDAGKDHAVSATLDTNPVTV